MKRVVVTGIGVLAPTGIGIDESWKNLCAGKSGIRKVSDFDSTKLRSKICGRIWDYNPLDHFDKKDARKLDPFLQYAVVASRLAVINSGLDSCLDRCDLNRAGVVIGSGIGGLTTIENEVKKIYDGKAEKVSPFFVPSTIVNLASGMVSIEFGFKGPNTSVVSACASGAHSIIQAAQAIAIGDADIMLAGGSEHASNVIGMAGFGAARALTPNNDNPQQASRPWDKSRDGFILSDGAGVLMLESLEHAQARSANILAELVGYGMTGDAYHITQPGPEGDGASRCMQMALKKAGIKASQVDYINAHGTSTPTGDQVEVLAVKHVFGEHAYKIPMSSTKSMSGHLLGAAGSFEAGVCIKALQDQIIPPTINCDEPDDGCDLDFVREGARKCELEYVLSNSFGFGGTNASLLLKRWP